MNRKLFIIKKEHVIKLQNHKTTDFRWQSLLMDGNVELIDTEEEETCMIAMEPKNLEHTTQTYTYCEIHPSMISGYLKCFNYSISRS